MSQIVVRLDAVHDSNDKPGGPHPLFLPTPLRGAKASKLEDWARSPEAEGCGQWVFSFSVSAPTTPKASCPGPRCSGSRPALRPASLYQSRTSSGYQTSGRARQLCVRIRQDQLDAYEAPSSLLAEHVPDAATDSLNSVAIAEVDGLSMDPVLQIPLLHASAWRPWSEGTMRRCVVAVSEHKRDHSVVISEDANGRRKSEWDKERELSMKTELSADFRKKCGTWLFECLSEEDANHFLGELQLAGCIRYDLESMYDLGDLLGQGSSGKVYFARLRGSGEELAAKFVAHSKDNEQVDVKLMREVELLRLANNHASVMQFRSIYFAASGGADYWVILTELLRGGELFDLVRKVGKVEEDRAQHVGSQLVSALAYIHHLRIAHRDIKTENVILVDAEGDRVKLVDFGIAAHEYDEVEMTRRCGSPGYAAPEVLTGSRYGCLVDCFSVGVLLYILLSGHAPFSGKDFVMILRRTVRCHVSYESFSPAASEFLQRMITKSPDDRMGAQEALEHPWIAFEARRRRVFFEDMGGDADNDNDDEYDNDNDDDSLHKTPGPTSQPPENILQESTLQPAASRSGAGEDEQADDGDDPFSDPEDHDRGYILDPSLLRTLTPVWARVQQSIGVQHSQGSSDRFFSRDINAIEDAGPTSAYFIREKERKDSRDLSVAAVTKAISSQGLTLGEMIGVGAFSKVFKASQKGSEAPVALKLLLTSSEVLLAREMAALERLKHPRLVSFLGPLDLPLNGFILELCEGGSVWQLLHCERREIAASLSLRQRIRGAVDIAAALQYMHEHRYMHRDVKSSNCLLEKVPEIGVCLPGVKLGDFGLSREVVESAIQTRPTSNIGTPGYMAPEVINGDSYSAAADLFSFAHVLYELASLEMPYSSKRSNSRLPLLIVGGLRPPVRSAESGQELFPNCLSQLMEMGWSGDVAARPTATSAYQVLAQYCDSESKTNAGY